MSGREPTAWFLFPAYRATRLVATGQRSRDRRGRPGSPGRLAEQMGEALGWDLSTIGSSAPGDARWAPADGFPTEDLLTRIATEAQVKKN